MDDGPCAEYRPRRDLRTRANESGSGSTDSRSQKLICAFHRAYRRHLLYVWARWDILGVAGWLRGCHTVRLRSWGTLHSDSVAAMTHRVNRPPSTHRELHCKNQALLNSESVTESMRQRFVSGCRINPPPLAPPRGGEVLTAGRAREPDAAKLCLARSRQRANEFVRVKSSLCPATPALDPAQFTHVKFKRGKNRVSVFYGWHLRHIFHGNKAARLETHSWDSSHRINSTCAIFIRTFDHRPRPTTTDLRATDQTTQLLEIIGYITLPYPWLQRRTYVRPLLRI